MAIAGLILAVAAGAWVTLALRMPGMGGAWAYPRNLGTFASSWVLMVAAMMLPTLVLGILLPGATITGRPAGAPDRSGRFGALAGGSAAFLAGYFVIWTAAGLVAYVLLGLVPAGAGSLSVAGVLIAAALYQLLPVKRRCLTEACITHPSPGETAGRPLAAIRRGVAGGAWCLGCCWALMASMLALGTMSLMPMIGIWILITVERILPRSKLARLSIALTLVALAAATLVGVPLSSMPPRM